MENQESGVKRKIFDGEKSNSKKLRIRKGERTTSFNLTNLPEDALLLILSHSACEDLWALSKTCTFFSRLCSDFTLWRNVTCTCTRVTAAEMLYATKNVHADTKKMYFRGPFGAGSEILCNSWLYNIWKKCPQLTELTISNYKFDCHLITLTHFPKILVKLDLSYSHVTGSLDGKSYFKDIYRFLPNLKILILTHCAWFEPHSLMAISKCMVLEELRINDCWQMHDCLAYCGLSTRAGFKNLKTLDLRRCAISNSELICFSSIHTLKHIYLEFCGRSSININRALSSMFFERDQLSETNEAYPFNKVRIETLVVRNYKALIDHSFTQFLMTLKYLKYVDISGSNVSRCAINSIMQDRPDLQIVRYY